MRVLELDWNELSICAAANSIEEIRTQIKSAFRRAVKRTHPDRLSGSHAGCLELQRAGDAKSLLLSVSDPKMFRKPRGAESGDERKLDQILELLDTEYFGGEP